ncbi:AAA family ATPase [Nocardioides sp. SYSU DS0651]|uniref:AAA family ATPase n=1 Tax=Nocardioides sp. SYSU DS0651 TaxID=3415955 RepID=UPI003F4B4163
MGHLPTPALTEVRHTAEYVIPRNEVMLVHGAIGTGRSTAVSAYLATQRLASHQIDLPPSQNAIKINTWLYRQLAPNADLPLRDLQDDLIEALGEQDRIIVIRNVERLTSEAAGQLQWLHAHPHTRFAMILIGDEAVGDALRRDPLLAHAITGTVHVKPLTSGKLLDCLQGLHPLLRNAEPPLLTAIDDQVCHGNLARWTNFLHRALWLYERDPSAPVGTPPRLDKRLAQATIASLAKIPNRKHT